MDEYCKQTFCSSSFVFVKYFTLQGFHDHAVTVMLVAWGQFMDHDFTLTAETRGS